MIVTERPVPEDSGNAAYLIFFWLGAGFLFPWNAFITGIDYFMLLYPDAHVDFLFAVAYMSSNLCTLLVVMRYGDHHSPKQRIFLGFSFFLALILLVPVLDFKMFNGGNGSTWSLFLLVGAVLLSGVIDGNIQGSLFGMAAQLPAKYTQALVAGTSASGVIITFTRILTKLALPGDLNGLRTSANAYFFISSLFVGLCLVGLKVLEKLPIFLFYEEKNSYGQNVRVVLGEDEQETSLGPHLDSSPYSDLPVERVERLYIETFMDAWEYPVALTFIYLITLSIFPGFISEGLHSETLGSWYPVLLFFSFNISDFMGKMIPSIWVLDNKFHLIFLTGLRVLFYPLFGLCLYLSTGHKVETFMFFLTMALGFTNGLLTSWLMMIAPSKVNPSQAESMGFIMVLFLIFGLFFGSLAGWIWVLVL